MIGNMTQPAIAAGKEALIHGQEVGNYRVCLPGASVPAAHLTKAAMPFGREHVLKRIRQFALRFMRGPADRSRGKPREPSRKRSGHGRDLE